MKHTTITNMFIFRDVETSNIASNIVRYIGDEDYGIISKIDKYAETGYSSGS